MAKDPLAPPKARVRKLLHSAKKTVSKTEREKDALDGCDLDFTENPTSNEEVELLLKEPDDAS